MDDNPSSYALVGAEPSLNHFPNTTNHYLLPHVKAAVQAAAIRFHQENPTWKLRINDASLEWGGIFDIAGSWNPSHRNHREGRNVDLGWNALKLVSGQWVVSLMPKDMRDDLKELMKSGAGVGGIESVDSEPARVHEHVIGRRQP